MPVRLARAWRRAPCRPRSRARRRRRAPCVPGRGRGICCDHGRRVARRLGEDDVVGVDALAELGQEIMRVDRAGLAGIRRKLGTRWSRLVALAAFIVSTRAAAAWRNAGDAFCRSASRSCVEDARAVALQPQLAREAPHRRAALHHVDVDLRPERRVVRLGVAREPRHVDVDQQAHIRLREYAGPGAKPQKHGAFVRDVVDHVGFEHADAGELGEPLDRLGGAGRAAGIGGDQDRASWRRAARRRAARPAADRRRSTRCAP